MQGIAGVLRADQVGKRESYALGGGEAIFAVENHAVAAIEHQDGGARALIFALMDHQIGIVDFDGQAGSIALDGVEQRSADVHIQRVAKFVGLGGSAGFDAGGEITGVVAAETALAERSEQIFQSFETEKIEGLVGDFETGLDVRPGSAGLTAGSLRRRRRNLRALAGAGNVAFLFHALDDLIDDVAEFLIVGKFGILQHLLHQFRGEQIAFLQCAEDRFAQFLHHFFLGAIGVHFVDPVLRFEAALQQEIGETAH